MFKFITLASATLAAVSAVSGLAIPRDNKLVTYAEGYLELYVTYHTRYLALDCENQHGKAFFDQCCHPLLATETLEKNRPAQCKPSASAAASASAAEPTSTVPTPSDPECSDEPESSSAAPTPASTHSEAPSSSAAPTSAPVNVAPLPPVIETSSSSSTPSPTHTPAPVTSHTPAPAPVTTHTSAPAPAPVTTSHTPAASPSPAASSGGSSIFSGGVATFFFQHNTAGACGTVHSDNDLIAAIDQARYGNSGSTSSLCGKQVEITNTKNSKTVTVTIADDCPTCINSNSIDLSQGAFNMIATPEEGEVPITWKFL